ncbi:MAG: hypothetical protein HYS13_07985 [Planctomycetia bacterium]|nr:hypothetical protein [Planctomycetia bacterium]
MATTTITIEVGEEAAKAFAAASAEARRKMELLLRLRLNDLTARPQRSLKTVMDGLGAQAASRGLTPETLESHLN